MDRKWNRADERKRRSGHEENSDDLGNFSGCRIYGGDVALCYLVPGWRLKLHATAWVYFTASLRHMALLKGVFAMAAGLVLATLPFLGMLREPLPEE